MRFVLSSFGPEQNRCVLLLRRRTKPKQILLSVTELPWQQVSTLTLFLLALGALLPFGGLRAIDVVGAAAVAVFALSTFQFALFFRSHQVNDFFRIILQLRTAANVTRCLRLAR